MTRKRFIFLLVVIGAIITALVLRRPAVELKPVTANAPKAALTVTATQPETLDWVNEITANGPIAAWQIATISSQISGVRLQEVAVDVGDVVKRGDVLARFDAASVKAALDQQDAAVARARATLGQEEAEARRADLLKGTGSMSAQELATYVTSAETARADLQLEIAKQTAQKLNYGYTTVVAPDDGIIAARTATIGAVSQNGGELFQLIRQNRLEWRAELPERMLDAVTKPGTKVIVQTAQGESIDGKVRIVSPLVDDKTRNGTVYVDLPSGSAARAGMYAQGRFILAASPALTVPAAAVVVRDGYSYVFRIKPDNHIEEIKVTTDRRRDDRIEIGGPIQSGDRLVLEGAGFLSDGDLVTVADEMASDDKAVQ